MIGFVERNFTAAGRRRAGRKGQSMTEYIIIVALVAIALITIITLFGNKLKAMFFSATKSLEEGKTTNVESLSGAVTDQGLSSLDDAKKVHNLKKLSGQDGE